MIVHYKLFLVIMVIIVSVVLSGSPFADLGYSQFLQQVPEYCCTNHNISYLYLPTNIRMIG
jgi:hypothetical protein